LNDSFYNHNLFSVFRADRDYSNFNLARGGGSGILVAVHHFISGCVGLRRYDHELNNKYVWTEITVNDGFSLLVGNHNVSPKSYNKPI
jgi:hypothetical protein